MSTSGSSPRRSASRTDGDPNPIGPLRQITTQVMHCGAERSQLVEGDTSVGLRAHAPDRKAPAVFGQRPGDTEADAARTAGDERGAFIH